MRHAAALGEVGPQTGQLFGSKADLLADFVAHALEVAELDAVYRQQLAGVVHAHALQHVLGFEAVAQLGHGGLRAGRGGNGGQATGGRGVAGVGCLACRKNGAPGAEHVFGVVEPLAIVALEGLFKKPGEAFARDGVEYILLDGGFHVEHGGRGLAIAPHRGLAHGHFVERDGQGKALGIQVPARRFAQGQEGVKVGVGAGRDVVGRGAAQREVEQNQLQLFVAVFCNADVFRLDVAMGDAFGFKVVDGFDQLFAKALQHVERQTAFLLELLRQVFITRTFEQQRGAASDGEGLAVGDDVVVVQAGQYLALGHQAVVVRDVASHFEDGLFLTAIAAHQQCIAGGATAHAPDDGEATLQTIARAGCAGVYGGLGVGRGEFILHQVQVVKKALDGVVARQQVGRGGELNEFLLPGAAAVQSV